MKDKVSKTLFSLSETDKQIQKLIDEKNSIESRRAELLEDLTATKAALETVEAQYRESESRRVLEEHRLRDEEQKIIERRKQLTAIGGVKSAKLVEREIDIASRALETLEKNLHEATGAAEHFGDQHTILGERCVKLEADYEEVGREADGTLGEIESKLKDLNKEHKVLLGKIEDRLKTLYRKVNTRYPGEAVALAKKGACRSCYRALPAQLYNQVMAGNRMMQCPGCSRILVFADTENGG